MYIYSLYIYIYVYAYIYIYSYVFRCIHTRKLCMWSLGPLWATNL